MSAIKFMTLLFSNVALKAKEVVLDCLGGGGGIARRFASVCFCTKFAESFGKLLVVITQESSMETLSVELLRVFLALAQSLNSFMHFVSLAVYFRTNP